MAAVDRNPDALDWQETLALERRRGIEQAMWTIPSASIAAQAFLYSRALDPGTSALGRLIAAIAGLVTAIATMQVLVEQTYRMKVFQVFVHEHRKNRGVSSIRRRDLLADFAGPEVDELKSVARGNTLRGRAATKMSSGRTWLTVMVVFAVIDAFTIGIAVAEIFEWWHPLD